MFPRREVELEQGILRTTAVMADEQRREFLRLAEKAELLVAAVDQLEADKVTMPYQTAMDLAAAADGVRVAIGQPSKIKD